jgi:hypothetical protein
MGELWSDPGWQLHHARNLLPRWESYGQIQAGSHIVRETYYLDGRVVVRFTGSHVVRETYRLDGRVMIRFRLAVTSCERLTT